MKFRKLYLVSNSVAVETVKNLYQALLVVSLYNGIINREIISSKLLYLIAWLLCLFAIGLCTFLVQSIASNLIGLSANENQLDQLVKTESSNEWYYRIISLLWILVVVLFFLSVSTNNRQGEINYIDFKHKIDSIHLEMIQERKKEFTKDSIELKKNFIMLKERIDICCVNKKIVPHSKNSSPKSNKNSGF